MSNSNVRRSQRQEKPASIGKESWPAVARRGGVEEEEGSIPKNSWPKRPEWPELSTRLVSKVDDTAAVVDGDSNY